MCKVSHGCEFAPRIQKELSITALIPVGIYEIQKAIETTILSSAGAPRREVPVAIRWAAHCLTPQHHTRPR